MQESVQQSSELPRIPIHTGDYPAFTRVNVCKEIDEWIGTPFVQKAQVKGVGTDCAGLIKGVAEKFGYHDAVGFVDYVDYDLVPDFQRMKHILYRYLDPVSKQDMLPADILFLYFKNAPQHLAFVMPDRYMVHAAQEQRQINGYQGNVSKHYIDDRWDRRIVNVFRFRGIQ